MLEAYFNADKVQNYCENLVFTNLLYYYYDRMVYKGCIEKLFKELNDSLLAVTDISF